MCHIKLRATQIYLKKPYLCFIFSSTLERADPSKPFYQRDICGYFTQVSVFELLPDAAALQAAAKECEKQEAEENTTAAAKESDAVKESTGKNKS